MFSSSKKGGGSSSSSTPTPNSHGSHSSNGGSSINHPGITNLGNSCYLSSILQGLAASRPLRDALAEYPGAIEAVKATTTATDADTSTDAATAQAPSPDTPTVETSPSLQLLTENPFPESLPLSSALANTLVKLWSGKQSTISAKTLMKALNRKSEDWNEWDQMDAHELLRYLLDGVSMEEMDLIKKIQPAQPVKPKKAKRQKVTRPAGEAAGSDASDSSSSADELETSEAESLLAEDPTYRPAPRAPQPKRYTPFIDTLFGGKLASVIVCEECRGVSRIEEDFLDISLPLKSDDAKLKRRDRLRKFLSTSAANASRDQKEAVKRPKMAARAPTAILSVSDTEGSEAEGNRARRIADNGSSAASGGEQASRGQSGAEGAGVGAVEDDASAKVRRRKSLDPSFLRSSNTKRNFLSPNASATSVKSRESSLSRSGSVKRSDAASGAETIDSDLSGTSDAHRKSKSAHLVSKPSREQQDYIRKLFAEVPGPSPLAGLRIAQPLGAHASSSSSSGGDLGGSFQAGGDASTTGLYSCLLQFTSVEALEGEDAFQCRRCWKLLNPGLVAQIGRKRAAKLLEQTTRKQEAERRFASAARLKERRPYLRDDADNTPTGRREQSQEGDDYWAHRSTPRGSVSAGSKTETMVDVNRQLLQTRERQRSQSEAAGTLSVPGSDAVNGPEIRITATSPPVSPADSPDALPTAGTSAPAATATASAPAADVGLAGFSSLRVSVSRGSASTDGDSNSSPSGFESDRGAEADEEVDAVERGSNASRSPSRASDAPSSISFAVPPQSSVGKPRAAVLAPGSPALPPRTQRYVARRAHKRYLISNLPPILVLHLKRFQQTTKSSMFGSFSNLKKLDDKISFPLNLDMAPFMAPPPPALPVSEVERVLTAGAPRGRAGGADEKSGGISASSAGEESDSPAKEKERPKPRHHHHWFRRESPLKEVRINSQYRLYAVICHQGNMSSGHYYALVLTAQRKIAGEKIEKSDAITKSDSEAPRRWVYCSDDTVRAASVDEVQKAQAYVLLYEKIQPLVGDAKL